MEGKIKMNNFRNNNFANIYSSLVKSILNSKLKRECRFAHQNIEENGNDSIRYLSHVMFELTNPKSCRLINAIRQPSHRVGYIEGVLLCDSTNEIKYMPWYKPFSRDGFHSYSMYGQWINPVLFEMIEKLRKFPNTRQCQFQIYNHHLNNWNKEETDVPCTTTGIFEIVNGKLNLTIFMRSNDLFLGTPYNVQMFCYLQQVVANTLNIPIGIYTHIVNNLHIYERDIEMLHSALNSKFKPAEMNIKYDLTMARYIALKYKYSIDNSIKFEYKFYENQI